MLSHNIVRGRDISVRTCRDIVVWGCDGDRSVGMSGDAVVVCDLLEPPVVLVGVQPNPPVLLLAPGELHAQRGQISALQGLGGLWGQLKLPWGSDTLSQLAKARQRNITLLTPKPTPRHQDQPPHKSIMTPAKPSTHKYRPSRKG